MVSTYAMSAKVGLIGTGMMGKAIATRLLKSGYKITVYNRTKEKAESLKALGAVVADTPMQVAKNSDLVITVVKDAAAVEEVAFGEKGIIHAKHDGLVLADVSTINPVSSRAIAKRLKENGITMLDTPVMGGPRLAEQGTLVLMIGGSKDTYEKYKQVFGTIGSKSFYLGENGSAHAMKLALNLQIAMIALALSEGITLTKGAGLNPELFLQILNSTYFKTGMSENKGPKMIQDDFEATFALQMMMKDLATINEAARAFNVTLPMASLSEQLYRAATNSNFGDLDYTGILAFLQKINGLK
ncbi:MAG: 3-hydroxyisobutyrate dehydrogenase [Candidatus Nitrosomirales archaeon]|jgi:3-hydroxyisobutyrate dehydrogenase